MPRRRTLLVAGCAAVAVLFLVVGLMQQGSRDGHDTDRPPLTMVQIQRDLDGSPPPLAALHRQAGQLLRGDDGALQRRIAALRGTPVVVNFWASWCPPCVGEAPLLGRASAAYGRRVAFLGVNVGDNDAAGRRALGRTPLGYPSFTDPDSHAAQTIVHAAGLPATAYYRADGTQEMIHQGVYTSQADLSRDIRRYALVGDSRRRG